jgi:hypothetical protein
MLTLTNPLSQELRNHLMPVLSGLGAVQHEIAIEDSQLSITYGKSPVVSEYHHERFGHIRFAGGPRAGDRAPDIGPLQSVDGGAVRLFDSCAVSPSPGFGGASRTRRGAYRPALPVRGTDEGT